MLGAFELFKVTLNLDLHNIHVVLVVSCCNRQMGENFHQYFTCLKIYNDRAKRRRMVN